MIYSLVVFILEIGDWRVVIIFWYWRLESFEVFFLVLNDRLLVCDLCYGYGLIEFVKYCVESLDINLKIVIKFLNFVFLKVVLFLVL